VPKGGIPPKLASFYSWETASRFKAVSHFCAPAGLKAKVDTKISHLNA
jgi:hypothetical protein